MNRHASQARPPVLVIGGMHRSTTSLAASIIAGAGVNLGDELMAAAAGNEEGHFEDLDFYMLHQRILASNGLSMEGFTCEERIDVPPIARDEAEALIARRRATGRPWGWKDPRTVLFLDFWADLLPEARWLFVVRPPWEVVDSLFRRGDTAFRASPRFAGDVWAAYNRRILDFVHTRPGQTAVVQAADVVADHAALVQVASDLLGTPLETPSSRYKPGLFVAGQATHRAGLVRAASPEAFEIYRSLSELAGADRTDIDRAGSPLRLTEVAEAGLIEWNKACQAIAERGGFSAELTGARQSLDAVTQELETARTAHAAIAAHAEELTHNLVTERAARADVTAYVEHLTQELTTERSARVDLQAELLAERAAAVEARDRQAAELAAVHEQLEAQRIECESRLAGADREWSNRLEAERVRREEAVEELSRSLVEARERVNRLTHAIEVAEEATAERTSLNLQLRAERNGLAAQLESERGIYEALRQDLTGRIETVRTGRRKAG